MKYYAFSITEKWIARSSCTQKTITVYRVKKNRLKLLFLRVDTFVDDFQLFIESMEIVGAGEGNYVPLCRSDRLPAVAFKRNQFGGWKYNAADLEEMGIAVVQQI
jgi:hypothetical protein